MAKHTPDAHNGGDYQQFLASLSERRGTRRYLEIGVSRGALLSQIKADVAVGVDPAFAIDHNVVAGKGRVILINQPSDRFFAEPELVAQLGGPPDLAFLDGFHTFEFLLRDFFNTEAISSRNTLIGLHDCLPLDDIMTIRDPMINAERTIGTRWQGSWTGDVWKIIPILRKYRPDLQLVYVDCAPTGIVFISNLDPANDTLQREYFSIVKEFIKLPNDASAIEKMYSEIELTRAEAITHNNDFSLYFR